MKLFQYSIYFIRNLPRWFLQQSWLKKTIILASIGILIVLVYQNVFTKKSTTPQYQTAESSIGNLIVSLSTTGQVSNASSTSVTTNISGVVSKIYVTNNQVVKAGDKIAEIELDTLGNQKYAQALASYKSAKNSLDTAQTNLLTLQSSMLTKWKTYMDTSQNGTYQNGDGSPNTDNRQLPQYYSVNNDWLAAEATYKNQQNVISQAQSSVQSAYLSLIQSSPTITAPISGTVTGLSLTSGTVLSASTDTTSTNKVANIVTNGKPLVSVNLTQIDIPKVSLGDKATIIFDAFADRTYTGKIISIDTVGSLSSGVANYPAVIELDTDATDIFANMSATVTIITDTRTDVLMVPNGAVTTQNSQSYVRTLENGSLKEVPVEIGIASDTQTEITSGLTEGLIVVTSINQNTSSTTSQTSIFSPFGASRSGVGGGNMRFQQR